MHITGMKIGGIPPFTEPVEFEFDERVNVFIGPNAAGKSTLLQYLLTEYQKDRWDVDGGDPPMSKIAHSVIDGREVYSSQSSTFAFEWQRSEISFDARAGAIGPTCVHVWDFTDVLSIIGAPIVAIPAARVRYDNSENVSLSHRFLAGVGTQKSGVDWMSEPLYSNDVHNIVNTIYHLIEDADDDINDDNHVDFAFPVPPKDMATNFQSAIDLAFRCARDICKEVIQGAAPGNDIIVTHGKTASGQPVASARVDIGVRIPVRFQSEREPLRITSLSAGTEGTLWWIRLVALTLLHAANYQSGWERKPAILLIDEIENHLHPAWQRRVIPALKDHFPGLQIFASTHSPFVVAGLKAGQVHLLNRDGNGVVTASANTENIEGWTADEILRVYMGVGEPTDEPTAQAAQALRRLRGERPRADEREEEERQAEIRRLRQIVDRAQLSGPRAAEDARFLANLEAILERYKESQDLNQENG